MDFAAPKVTQMGENRYAVSYGDDSGIYVEFENIPILNEARGSLEGRACYDDVPHIKIMFPGDKTKVLVRKVRMEPDAGNPSDPQRFPKQWERFISQQEQKADGTPITEWPPITKGQAMELKAIHVHTVETLAAFPDGALSWMGARELREKAKAWLNNAKGGSEVTRLLGENDTLRNDVEVLKRQVAELVGLTGKPVPTIESPKITRKAYKPRSAKLTPTPTKKET